VGAGTARGFASPGAMVRATMTGRCTKRSYLSFEGEVSWEPEHELQLVYEDGQRVCKVRQYDGHVTVADAYGDPSLLGVVFG